MKKTGSPLWKRYHKGLPVFFVRHFARNVKRAALNTLQGIFVAVSPGGYHKVVPAVGLAVADYDR